MKFLGKLLGLYLCAYIGSLSAIPDYHPLAVYGGLTYNVLVSFENANPGCSSDAILDYLRGKALIHIRSDAFDMGYGWRRVLKAAYHIAMGSEEQHVAIVEALNKEMRFQLMWKDVTYWIALVGASFSTVISFVSIGSILHYRKYDRKVVLHYRSQSLGGLYPASDSD